jgi:uncharacterized protein (TIRG00374 family)
MSRRRRLSVLAAKIGFAAIVITWLLCKVDASRVWQCLREARGGPVLLGVTFSLLSVAIGGWRWQRLLRIFDVDLALKPLICITQIGQFFTMFLPGPTGDDLTRMLYISSVAKGRAREACASVLLDRVIGLASLLLLSLVCIPRQWELLAASTKTYWLAVGMLGAGSAIAVGGISFLVISVQRSQKILQGFLPYLPSPKLREELARLNGLLGNNKSRLLQVTGAAVGTQLLLCSLFYLAGTAVGIHLPLLTWLSFVPIVLAANAVPITMLGIGVREYLLVLFLGVLAHVEGERALAASFVVFSIILTVGLIGGLVYVFYKPQDSQTVASS